MDTRDDSIPTTGHDNTEHLSGAVAAPNPSRVNAEQTAAMDVASVLTEMERAHPELQRRERQARQRLAAAITALDTLPGRPADTHDARNHEARVVAEVERSKAGYAQALADLLRVDTRTTQERARRCVSTNPAHLREDLTAALEAAVPPDTDPDVRARAAGVVAELDDVADSEAALRRTAAVVGAEVFGTVLRFHIDAQTSLMGQAEMLCRPSSLDQMGISLRDLRWPEEVLSWPFVDDAAPADPDKESRLAAGVAAWKDAHPHERNRHV